MENPAKMMKEKQSDSNKVCHSVLYLIKTSFPSFRLIVSFGESEECFESYETLWINSRVFGEGNLIKDGNIWS